MRCRALLTVVVMIGWAQGLWAAPGPVPQAPRTLPPPRAVVAEDDPDDPSGVSLRIQWQAPATLPAGSRLELVGYQVLVGKEHGDLKPTATVAAGDTRTTVGDLRPGQQYMVQVVALYAPPGTPWFAPQSEPSEKAAGAVPALVAPAPAVGPARPVGLWYDPAKTNVLVGIVLYTIIVVLCFTLARKRSMYIRPIAGLEAVEDAVGRATEMGKPMLFVAGLSSIGDIATIAAMLILGHLAKRTAAYETPILVPAFDPLVMAAKREIVREAYIEAGRPQNYRPDNIFFVTDSQFGYVAAVDGIMLRERPAANFFMGSFAAESLILAETGNQTGAIQIAGTDSDTQLPFFITACDYTLMGEELYAASAYLTRHPTLLAQLKGQDMGKAIIIAVLVLVTVTVTALQAGGMTEAVKMVLGWFAT